jgi:putative adhesin
MNRLDHTTLLAALAACLFALPVAAADCSAPATSDSGLDRALQQRLDCARGKLDQAMKNLSRDKELEADRQLDAFKRLQDRELRQMDQEIAKRKDQAPMLAEADAAARSAADTIKGVDLHDEDDSGGDHQVNEHRPLNANGEISLNNMAGTVVVSAWDKNEVDVTGEIDGDIDHLDVSGDAAHLSIVARSQKRFHGGGSADLHLMVPAGAKLTLETVSADVSVSGLRGPLKVNTVSGDVGLAVTAPVVSVQTTSGDVILQGSSADTIARSVSGDLRMSGLQGLLDAETVSGNVDVIGTRFSGLKLKSISGDVHLDVSFTDKAHVTGETLSGDITMLVPADLSGTGTLKSFSGEAICDKTPVETSNSPGSKKREYVWGDGKGVDMELSTFSGDIHINRKPAVSAR